MPLLIDTPPPPAPLVLQYLAFHVFAHQSGTYLTVNVPVRNYPFKYEAQTAVFKDPVRTA